MQQQDDGDVVWTFPMSVVPAAPPPVATVRRIAIAACTSLAGQLRAGACPLRIATPLTAPLPGWSHWHPYPELFVQCAGASIFDTPGGELHLPTGACLLFPAISPHLERNNPDGGDFCNLVFTVHEHRLTYHLALPVPGQPHLVRIATPDVVTIDHVPLQSALVAMGAADADDDLRAAGLLTVCAHLRRAITQAPPPGEDASDRINRVRDLVQARLTSGELSVAQLARWLGRHPDHLARCFRRETGETLVGYIVRSRLERARTLLADPRLRVADAARLSGFADPAYFSRAWRRQYGRPPSAGRR
jgi:AraC-like DNA-binding protein